MPGQGPAEALEELEGYATWLVDAWRTQAKAITSADDPAAQGTAAREGMALLVTSAVKAGITALNAVAILTQLDADVLTLAKGYKVKEDTGVRQLSVPQAFVLEDDPKVTIPAANVIVKPTVLQPGVVEFTLQCGVKGCSPGVYSGTVEVTRDGAVIQTKTVMLNI
jgi:hypothetical protein